MNETPLGGYRVVSLQSSWSFAPETLAADLRTLANALGLRPGATVWVMAVGWDHANIDAQLPAETLADKRHFGRITLIKVIAP